jgi:hypothetical protein
MVFTLGKFNSLMNFAVNIDKLKWSDHIYSSRFRQQSNLRMISRTWNRDDFARQDASFTPIFVTLRDNQSESRQEVKTKD